MRVDLAARRDREKRSPEDLRRTLGKIYPEEILDELMEKLGFGNEETLFLTREDAEEKMNGGVSHGDR